MALFRFFVNLITDKLRTIRSQTKCPRTCMSLNTVLNYISEILKDKRSSIVLTHTYMEKQVTCYLPVFYYHQKNVET
jgi:hypothetical protein